MNDLWIFGDSFSCTIDFTNLNNENVKNYLSIKNITSYETWSESLSHELNLSLKNFASGGKSNYQIFFDFCDNVDKIKSGDVVIIGWALIGKFIIVDNERFVDVHPLGQYHHYNISNESLQEIIENRKNEIWANEVEKWKKIIHEIANQKKFKIIFWSAEEKTLKNDKIDLSMCDTLMSESNGVISDTHLGFLGHKKLSQNFFNIINQ